MKPTQNDHERPQDISLPAGLYLIATPIGNLRDISLRALDVLHACDLVVCEDTRVTGKLLNAYDIKKKMHAYHDHSSDTQRQNLVQKIEEGQVIALVSDAGMPLIADPGYKLVQACYERSLPVHSIPGANAALMALQLSGLPTDSFHFIGFLPPKSAARQKELEKYKMVAGSLIAYETAPRLLKSLEDIYAVLGERVVAVTRELTKLYEEVRRDSLTALIAYYQDQGPPKGEIVLVIDGAKDAVFSDQDLIEELKLILGEMSHKDAVDHVVQKTGASKKHVYDLALSLKG